MADILYDGYGEKEYLITNLQYIEQVDDECVPLLPPSPYTLSLLPPSTYTLSTAKALCYGWRHFLAIRRNVRNQAFCELANLVFKGVCHGLDSDQLSEEQYSYWKERIMVAVEQRSRKFSIKRMALFI